MFRSVKFWITLCILELGVIIWIYLTPQPIPEIIIDEIEKRDSIFIVNEKIEQEIIYVKERYKKDSIDIMSASDSVLLDSFSRYIENYNNK